MPLTSGSPKIVAIVQARMSSRRLPGKSLLPLSGKPLVIRVLERVAEARGIAQIVLATSEDVSDDVLAHCVAKEVSAANWTVFRGDLTDVRKRYYDAAASCGAAVVIRVTADNPLTEPLLLENLIQRWNGKKEDYVACDDCISGVGAELFTMEAFKKSILLSDTAYAREHVTPGFYQNEKHFRIGSAFVPEYLKDAEISLTVDTQSDYEKVSMLYSKFFQDGKISNAEIVSYLKKENAALR